MALGFRKSLFGFNQEDVTDYISRQAVKNTQIQTELNTKIKENEKQIASLIEAVNIANEENGNITKQLDFYREKYEEVKTLSDNIGKLYLVAQSNAKAIMSAANEAKTATDSEIQQNIAAIDAANEALNSIKLKINDLCDNFTSDVEKLNQTLKNTKSIIENSTTEQDKQTENFEKVYKSL